MKTLGEIADVICGPFGSAIKKTDYQEAGIPLVRITNISKEGYIDYEDLIYISEELGNSLSRTQVSSGDIVISQRGSLGQCAVVDDTFEKMNISANIIAIKNIRESSATFIHDYLLSIVGQTLLERNVSGQVQQKITTQDIANILIPIGCDEKRLSKMMTVAYCSYRNKIELSEKLLSGMSEYILASLALSFDIPYKRVIYATKLSDIDSRLDADYYSPKFSYFRKQIENFSYYVLSIGEITENITSGFAAGKQDQADSLPDEKRVPHLRPFNITAEGKLSFDTQKFVPKKNLRDEDYCKKNEVIFNNTNSPGLVGKTTVFDSDVLCTASNHITRITVKDGINPYYIAAFFNVLLSIGYWKLLCTNFNNQAGVNTETLKKVRIPVPPKNLQDEIATEFMLRRSKANKLHKEAEQEWQAAKEKFAKELLGE